MAITTLEAFQQADRGEDILNTFLQDIQVDIVLAFSVFTFFILIIKYTYLSQNKNESVRTDIMM